MAPPEPDSAKVGKSNSKRRARGKDAAERVSFGVLNVDKPLDTTTDEKMFPGPNGQSIDAEPARAARRVGGADDAYQRRQRPSRQAPAQDFVDHATRDPAADVPVEMGIPVSPNDLKAEYLKSQDV